MQMQLFPIDPPGADATVFAAGPEFAEDGPLFAGEGGALDLACGTCGRVLATSLTSVRQLTG
ncbi:MAG: hypothetical protein QOC66_1139 [Pseudonocardiales bacterium]|nr:hypothetical protein [Pseudonocardiales bacterium]